LSEYGNWQASVHQMVNFQFYAYEFTCASFVAMLHSLRSVALQMNNNGVRNFSAMIQEKASVTLLQIDTLRCQQRELEHILNVLQQMKRHVSGQSDIEQ